MNIRPKTLILDLDGTLIWHHGTLHDQMSIPKLLPGVKEKFDEWDKKCYRIIILTGRKESMRELTISQLAACGIFYDQLVLGVGGGTRVLVNDLKPNSDVPTAVAINLERNKGITELDI